ncbi:hypothetical protein JB92DRAFT_2723569, partial [Gautieria morchelliformis]
DHTDARVVGRIFAPPSSPILMDIISLTAYPGDPTSDDYEIGVPDDSSVAVWTVGAVLDNAKVDADSQTRAFNLAVSDYFRDGTKTFALECVYDGNSVHWSRAPAPNVNMAIYAYGTFRKVNEHGNLSIVVDNVALNVGPATLAPCSFREGWWPASSTEEVRDSRP